MENMVQQVVDSLLRQAFIPVEASGRHVHLSRAAVDTLFGPGYQLTPDKPLSQPGQYACRERVTVRGPKGALERVAVLGPERPESQVEVSMTDALALGIKAPVRLSGSIAETPGCTLSTERGSLQLPRGVIVAQRHIHMTPEDGRHYGLRDKDVVSLRVYGQRPVVLAEVPVRIGPGFATAAHIDYDEANACGFRQGVLGRIIQAGE